VDALDALNRRHFILLTSYAERDAGIVNRLWFTVEGSRIVALSSQGSEAERIRPEPRVLVAGIDRPGDTPGTTYEGRARILPASDRRRVNRLLNRKYGWRRRLFRSLLWPSRIGERSRWRRDLLIEIELLEPHRGPHVARESRHG